MLVSINPGEECHFQFMCTSGGNTGNHLWSRRNCHIECGRILLMAKWIISQLIRVKQATVFGKDDEPLAVCLSKTGSH